MKVAELFEEEERSVLSVMGPQPDYFDATYNCDEQEITSLEGCPSKIGKDFFCDNNHLTSLDFAPSFVGEDFFAYNNEITSLHNIHKQIKHIGGILSLENNPITSCVLGVLLIDGLQNVFMYHPGKNKINVVAKILQKHLKGDRDVFACQEELINLGFDDFAKL